MPCHVFVLNITFPTFLNDGDVFVLTRSKMLFKEMLCNDATGELIYTFSLFVLDLNQQFEGGVGATLGGCGFTRRSLRASSQ